MAMIAAVLPAYTNLVARRLSSLPVLCQLLAKRQDNCITKAPSLSQSMKRPSCRHLCSEAGKKPMLTLFTNDDCTLCDEAMKTLEPFLDQVQVERVDITLPKNKEWFDKYRYDIPVFHLNGEFLMKHRANLDIFKKKLSEIKHHSKKQ